jgi:hypothetical protein
VRNDRATPNEFDIRTLTNFRMGRYDGSGRHWVFSGSNKRDRMSPGQMPVIAAK